jgi:DNA-binding CsgD family transcriptional regulator
MFHNIFKDISGFYIQPYLNGFKLVHEKIFENADSFSFIDNALTPVLSLENSAYSFYIVNKQHIIEWYNQGCLMVSGHTSILEAIGNKTGCRGTIQFQNQIISINLFVTRHKRKLKCVEVMYQENGDFDNPLVSYKCPWYDDSSTILGIVGISAKSTDDYPNLFLSHLSKENTRKIPQLNDAMNSISFSNQEMNCFQFLVRGMTSKEIAQKMNLSYRTVENYLARAKYKANVTSKSQLIEFLLTHLFNVSSN